MRNRRQQARTSKNTLKRKQLITQLWEQTASVTELETKLKQAGFTLVQGEKCQYALVEADGDVHNLVRQLPTPIKKKQVDERLGEYYQELPELKEVQAKLRQAKEKAEHKRQQKLEQSLNRVKKGQEKELNR